MPRREHKERSQPAARKHLGILEKKKDHIERSTDFKRKIGHITNLKKKAADKNPDEFYYAMLNSKTTQGVHEEQRKDGLDKLSHEEVCLMKDQDMKYLRLKQSMDERKAERLQSSLHLMLDKAVNKHTIFVDSKDEATSFDPASHFLTDRKLVGRSFNRPRISTLEGVSEGANAPSSVGGIVVGPANMKQLKKAMKQKANGYKELTERLKRAGKLKRLVEHKQVEKNLMGKGSKRKVKDAEGGAPAVYRWKRQRAK